MAFSFPEFLRKRYYYLSAILLFLSFPSFDLWFLRGFPLFAWVSLVPLFVALRQAEKKELYFTAYFTGFFATLFTYNWIRHFGASVEGGSFVVLLFLVPFLTIFFAAKAFIAEVLSRIFPAGRLVIFPAVWLAVDYVQSIGHLAFPWPYLGYSQYPVTPLIQMASITGVSGVTFLIVMVNGALADLWIERKNIGNRHYFVHSCAARKVLVLLILVAVITVSGAIRLALAGKSEKGITVAMVQSCIDPWKSWNSNRFRYLDELTKYTRIVLEKNPDLVVWSESATLESISFNHARNRPGDFEKKIFSFVDEINRPLLTGEIGLRVTESEGRGKIEPLNNAVLLEPGGKVQETYSKIHLVPFGEWFPYGKWFPMIQELLDRFGASSFVPGTEPRLFSVEGLRFGTLICYEGIFYSLSRAYRNMGADFLVNITNDGWTDTYSGHMQHYSASVFRAVENGVSYVRAGNTGYTVIIDPFGREVVSMPILARGAVAGKVDPSLNRATLYGFAGDLATFFSITGVLVLLVVAGYRKFRESRYER